MKITVDDINKRNDPYQLFLDNIKNKETARKYQNYLFQFLRSIPNEIYQKALGKTPQEQEKKVLATIFVELAKKDAELATNIIAAYIKEGARAVEAGQLKGGTFANHIKPIKALLDSNRIPIHWKSLYRMLPKKETPTDDRAYTKQELQKMLEVAHDITDKIIIPFFIRRFPG